MALRIGRVVIESADFVVSVSLPAWTPTEEEERVQHTQNAEALHRFLQRLEAALGPRKEVEVPEHREMDEFEWERFLKQSDARSTQFGELLEKYHDHPDRDTIIAKAMGWEQYPPLSGIELPDMNDVDDESEPDPSREGIDWIRTEHGDLRHPLQHICREGLGAFQRVDVRGMLPDEYPAYRDELLRLMDAYRA